MVRASKRAKTTATLTSIPDDADSGGVSAPPQPLISIPFQTGPSLERIPDDVLHEILSHLPTFNDNLVSFGGYRGPVIPSDALVRTPVLRALSQTSRVLRSRCLAMAWQRVELCGANNEVTFFRTIGEATRTGVRVLKACPHLLPLVQTMAVVLSRYQSDEIIPPFAACLATLPNLTSIQVVHAHSQMMTAIKNGFGGKRFPSVRRITLPCSAHEIIKCCPNLEEVICTEGNGSTIIGSLVKGNCHQVRVLKGISAPLTRLVKLLPNLNHISVGLRGGDMKTFTSFPLLDTIEIIVYFRDKQDLPLTELAASKIKDASRILKENESRAEKTVIVTKWKEVGLYMMKEVVKV